MKAYHLLITCEHAGNQVPPEYIHLFNGAIGDLNSHLGYDPGAIVIARELASLSGVRIFENQITRLLVESNRSIHSDELFSKYTKSLSETERIKVMKVHYLPYRTQIEKYIRRNIVKHPVIHLSIHTFTPVLNGVERDVEIGLLFDEERYTEQLFCDYVKGSLTELVPQYCTMMNVPYHGADDGFTTHLRKIHPVDRYLGIEIEVSQKFIQTAELNHISTALHSSIISAIDQLEKNSTIAL